MIRSLFSIILAVIIGLTAAKFIEGVGAAAYPPAVPVDLNDLEAVRAASGAFPTGYKLMLALGWGGGAFISAIIALALGRRWAPLGGLAAATIFFNSVITLLGMGLSWWLWPLSAAACAGGGVAALTILKPKPLSARENRSESDFLS